MMTSLLAWLAIPVLAIGLLTCGDDLRRAEPNDPNRVYTTAELEKALMRPHDLGGSAWELQPEYMAFDEDDEDEVEEVYCDGEEFPGAFDSSDAVRRGFDKVEDDKQPGLGAGHQMTSLVPDQARALMDRMRASYDCGAIRDSNGWEWTVEPMVLPLLGDESFAIRLNVALESGIRYTVSDVYVRDGTVVSRVGYVAVAAIDVNAHVAEVTERFAQRMAQRIKTLP